MNHRNKITVGVARLSVGHVKKSAPLHVTFDYKGETYTATGEITHRVFKKFKTLQVLSCYSTEDQKDFSGKFGDEFRTALKHLIEKGKRFYTTESKKWTCNVYIWSIKKDQH